MRSEIRKTLSSSRAQRLRLRREVFAGIDKLVALKLVLFIVELPVSPVRFEQFFMSAALNNLTAFQHQDLIGAANRRKPVSDHERRAPAAQLTQPVLNQGFAFAVQAGSCLVKDQQFGVGENGARDGDALSLSAGKFYAALAHHGVVLQ